MRFEGLSSSPNCISLTSLPKKDYMKIFYTLLLSFSFLVCQAQDPYFSQYNAASQQTNPVMTGLFEGEFRANINFREQWASVTDVRPYRTMAASFDMKKPFLKRDYMGFGLTVLRDEAQGTNLTQNRAHFSYAYAKHVGGSSRRRTDQYLIIAGQGGIGQNMIEGQNLWFSNQYDAELGAVNFGAASGETALTGNSNLYIDANAGLMWYGLFGKNRSLYFGASAHHLNSPNISFFDEKSSSLEIRYSIQAGGKLPLTKNLSLLPSIIGMRQGPSMTIIGGGSLRYNSRDWKEVALRIGAWGHVSNRLDQGMLFNAFILGAALEMTSLQIGLSYDLTTSQLAALNSGRGAFELSITYIKPSKDRRLRVNCPKF